MRKRIRITAEHIANAKRRDSHQCMIADAIHDAGGQFVSVDIQTITFTDRKADRRLTFLTPPSGQEAIVKWDSGKPVAPFNLVLSRPIHTRQVKHYRTTDNVEVIARARKRYKNRLRRLGIARMGAPVVRFREFGLKRLTK